MSRLFYGPPDWVVDKLQTRERRAIGFWTFIVSAALAPLLGNFVWYVTILSVVALVPNFASETPVEVEGES